MPILLLLAAHLTGDFVLQPNKLIEEKYISWHGTAKHALIITACNAFFMIPYWEHWKAWLVIFGVGAVHFAQDLVKVGYDKEYNPERHPTPFFADQIVHMFVILIFASFVIGLPGDTQLTLFQEPVIVGLYILMLAVSYVFDITKYQFNRQKKPKLKYQANPVSMLKRIALFSFFYLLILFLNGFGA